MIKIEKTIHGTKMITVWFADNAVSEEGIIRYKESKVAIGEAEQFDTLISDLTEEEEEIKSHFSKGCRYEVNRAYREKTDFELLIKDDITDVVLNEFLDFFDAFWKSKGLYMPDRNSLFEELRGYRDNNSLLIAYAKIDDVISVYHTLIYDDVTARLLHSASLFRMQNEDDGKKKIIGMANRALHFEEMKFFKQKGLKTFDWGGAGKGEDVASITEFKKSFGGIPVTYYESECVVGLKASLVSGISELKNRFK